MYPTPVDPCGVALPHGDETFLPGSKVDHCLGDSAE
jgi:hypothetical protein